MPTPPVPPEGNQPVPQGEAWTNALWAVIAAFGTYFSMYAFRKPFTAGSYKELDSLGDFDLKTLLVVSQVSGYMVSKFLGIKFISELPPRWRAASILVLIGLAELALIGFALTPAPWGMFFLFLNGLPLGMVFGLVLGFLEGRRQTEALAAGLCASFILADGFTKSLGTWLLDKKVSELWMPAAAGGCFLLPTLVFVGMLSRIRPPDHHDVAARSERGNLNHHERKRLFRKYALGLVPLILAYLLVTILRSVRADFQPQIFKGLGVTIDTALFTKTEFWVAAGVIVVNGTLVTITDNRRAFFTSLVICMVGFLILLGALLGLQSQSISPVLFVVLAGLGLYFPYVAVHTTVFERLLAATKDKGTSSYLLYLADSYGYLGYIAVLLAKDILPRVTGRPLSFSDEDFSRFFLSLCWIVAFLGFLLLCGATWFFLSQLRKPQPSGDSSTAFPAPEGP